MKIHIITPCSRPYNLKKLYESIDFSCEWWIIFDSKTFQFQDFKPKNGIEVEINYGAIAGGVAGKSQINFALDRITSGWVYVLDDDNLVHPDFKHLLKWDEFTGGAQGIIFSQQLSEGAVRHNHAGNIKICQIDQAQFLLKRSLIGDRRYLNSYEADGMFISKLYRENPGKFIITNEVLSYYNRLTWKK